MTSTEKITAAAETAGLSVVLVGSNHEIRTSADGETVGSFITANGRFWGGYLKDRAGYVYEMLSVKALVAGIEARA